MVVWRPAMFWSIQFEIVYDLHTIGHFSSLLFRCPTTHTSIHSQLARFATRSKWTLLLRHQCIRHHCHFEWSNAALGLMKRRIHVQFIFGLCKRKKNSSRCCACVKLFHNWLLVCWCTYVWSLIILDRSITHADKWQDPFKRFPRFRNDCRQSAKFAGWRATLLRRLSVISISINGDFIDQL